MKPTPAICPTCEGQGTTAPKGQYPTKCAECGGIGAIICNAKTLRDEFAMATLTGATDIYGDPDAELTVKQMALHCYRQADAMLDARGGLT